MNRWITTLLVCLAGCSVRAGNPQPPPRGFEGLAGQIVAGLPPGEDPVAGATVEIGNQKTVTDEQGQFKFDAVTGDSEKLTVSIKHSGYAPAVRVYPRQRMQGRFITIRTRAVDAMKRIKVSDGGVIVLPGEPGAANEAAVRFPPRSIVSDAEFIDVSLSVVRPIRDEERRAFPGEYIGISDDPKGSDLLRTLGTMDISFAAYGKPLDGITLREPATMQLALDDKFAAEFAEGETVPTWWLDPATGAWEREGSATIGNQNGRRIANWAVRHFTWWNVDLPLITHGCAAIRLSGTDAISRGELAHLGFTLDGVDYAGESPLATFDDSGLAVATGWRGHQVKPGLRFLGVENATYSQALLQANIWKSGFTFALPETTASSYTNKGPGGVPLDPEKHCHYMTYPFTIQYGSVGGKVLDTFGRPLADAVVAISETGQTARSAADGSFRFDAVPWNADGSLGVSLSAFPPAVRGDLAFETLVVKRDKPDTIATLIAMVRQVPPLFTQAHVSDSSPGAGSTIDFGISVVTPSPTLQWGLQVCGRETVLSTAVNTPSEGGRILCHLPPGNRENVQTISVSDAAVPPHLEHGDTMGPCPGVDPAAPPMFTANLNDKSCSGRVSDLSMTHAQSGSGYVYDLRGKWHGGDARESQNIVLVAKDHLGYETQGGVTAYWRNNTPVIMLSAPAYSPIGAFVEVDSGAIDPDGDAITVTWKFNGKAAGTGLQATLGPTVAGANIVEVRVSDGTYEVIQQRKVLATPGCLIVNCTIQSLAFVALLEAPPYAPAATRQALLASIIEDQFFSAVGTPKYERYRNFMDLQWKRFMDADPASPLEYDANTYQYQPASNGYEPTQFFPQADCFDIPLVGSACLFGYFYDADKEAGQRMIEYNPALGAYSIKVIDEATGTFRIDVEAPVSLDMVFEPPVTASVYDMPNSTVTIPADDLSAYIKAKGTIETGPFRFRYLVTMPTDASATAASLVFYPLRIGWATVLTYDEFGNVTSVTMDGDFQMITTEYGPFCNHNLATTDTPLAGADYESDPEKRPFGNDGLPNYPGLISDALSAYYAIDYSPYPHSVPSSGGGSGVGRDQQGLGTAPYEFSHTLARFSDNPNNCARPADACPSTSPLQHGGPDPYPGCELPNVSNNADDATYRLTMQFTSVIPYLQAEMKMRFWDMDMVYWEQ